MPEQNAKWNARDYAKNSTAQSTWANELIAKLALKGDETLLDIGCGNGRITDAIAGHLPDGKVIGIDFSSEMISLAAESFKRPNLTFRAMDASNIELDTMFDIAFSNAVLHWIKDHKAVLESLRMHLKTGAKILLQMGGYGNAAEVVEVVEQVIELDDWKAYFEGFEFPYYFYNTDVYEKLLPITGYKPERIELIPKDMSHESPEGLKGWLRTTWFPYTARIPEDRREEFLSLVISEYLKTHPVDENGCTHVAMVRLEVEARAV